jgi:hypothetical protein
VSNFQAVYYRDADGREHVREFVDGLDDEAQAAIGNQIDRLNMLSDEVPHLPFPHSSQVEGELRELRCHYGRDHYRILYRRSERLLVLCTSSRSGRPRSRSARFEPPGSAGRTSRHGWTPSDGGRHGPRGTMRRKRG